MQALWHLFSVNNVALTILGYPMSYVELLGTIFNLWSVWLVARNNILTWPVGLVGVVLFLALFYQIRLYSDTLEQIYYLGASVYGWWWWLQADRRAAAGERLRFSARPALLTAVAATLALGAALGWVTSRLNIWLPQYFPEPASLPYLDALTTVMSFTATILMAWKRIECWVYWIIVDVIGIGLYFAKDVKFIALLYVVFLVLASLGLRSWLRTRRAAPQPALG